MRRRASEETSVSRLVELAVRQFLRSSPTSAESPVFELVTFGAGGRFSTHDVDKTSALNEADDIERSRF